MPKSPPEKLAAALRANLKRRKSPSAAKEPDKALDSAARPGSDPQQKPPEKSA